MKFNVTRLSPDEWLDKKVDANTRLFAHLRGPGHGLTEDEAVRVVLQDVADEAKKYLP